MKSIFSLLFFFFVLCVHHLTILGQDEPLEHIDQFVKGQFNQDSIEDLLIIYANSIELEIGSYIDTCIPHKSVLYIGDANGNYIPLNRSNKLFPCPNFGGRSDNTYDSLVIKENSILWRTCVAPFFSSSYSIQTFTFRYSVQKHYFTLTEYNEKIYSSPDTEIPVVIHLSEDDLLGADEIEFDMNNWLESGHVFSVHNVIINENRIPYWENLSKQFDESSEGVKAGYIKRMIQYYFPDH